MTELTRHSTAVPSVYTLIGTLENDLTAALGYTLTRSQTLRATILRRVCRPPHRRPPTTPHWPWRSATPKAAPTSKCDSPAPW